MGGKLHARGPEKASLTVPRPRVPTTTLSAWRDAAKSTDAAWAWMVNVAISNRGVRAACAAPLSTIDRQSSSMLGTSAATVSAASSECRAQSRSKGRRVASWTAQFRAWRLEVDPHSHDDGWPGGGGHVDAPSCRDPVVMG